jgi:predicted nuclease with TOPRIM domain
LKQQESLSWLTCLFPQANNKFGKLLEENSALRKEIDSLRVERQRFDNLYKKLDKEKQDLQKETNEIIDQSTQAYDQRLAHWLSIS